MRRGIVAPLCSAFVIPGLGQVINQQLRKGGIILSVVFGLFVVGIILLARIVSGVLGNSAAKPWNTKEMIQQLSVADLSLFWLLIAGFALLWFYSVVDAYLIGRRLDRADNASRP